MIIKKKIAASMICAFVLLSIIHINSNQIIRKEEDISSVLVETKISEVKQDTNDYSDENGIQTAADDQSNIIIKKKSIKKGTGILEEYFDNNNNPVTNIEGYHSILREYDNKGNNIKNTYMDFNENPIISSTGYAIEKISYSDDGRKISIRYFDINEKPICIPSYGYGKDNEYDENGRVCKITYVDDKGNPYKIKRGYAIITRTYYHTEDINNGKIEYEFYFDENNKPISLANGEYGFHKEHRDNHSFLTYLNANGEPIVTLSGYTSIARTLNADNSVNTEMYFDIDGNPMPLADGQYGIKIANGKTVYLDQNGHEMFSIKTFLYANSQLVIAFAFLLIILSAVMKKKLVIISLILYIFVVLYMTIMFRNTSKPNVNIELFWSYKQLFRSSGTRADILRNIWLFIPIGALLYQLYPKKIVLLYPVFISILIEIYQFFSGTGLCELDDIISNGLGGCIGFCAEKMVSELISYVKERKILHTA